jgi:hypothetical protein
MMAKSKGQSWWEAQGYAKDHPVFSKPAPADPAEAEADESDVEAEIGEVQLTNATRSSNPARPRTQMEGYNRATQTLAVRFREGAAAGGETAVYHYYNVPPELARQFRKSASPGKFINRRLQGYAYGRVE